MLGAESERPRRGFGSVQASVLQFETGALEGSERHQRVTLAAAQWRSKRK